MAGTPYPKASWPEYACIVIVAGAPLASSSRPERSGEPGFIGLEHRSVPVLPETYQAALRSNSARWRSRVEESIGVSVQLLAFRKKPRLGRGSGGTKWVSRRVPCGCPRGIVLVSGPQMLECET
jgi:hypothetical protein